MTDGVAIKGKYVIIPSQLQMQVLKQIHNSHVGIEKTRLLVCKSMYWLNTYEGIENTAE